MLSLKFNITPSGQRVADGIAEGARGFRDWRTAWKDVAPDMKRSVQENIRGQGGPIGARWPELSAPYRKRRGSGAMLILTGELMGSIDLVDMQRMSVSVGIRRRIRKAAALDAGSRRRNLPERAFMRLSPSLEKDVMDAAADRLDAILEEMVRG